MTFTLLVEGQPVWLPAVALLGVAVGYVAGMFGVGGGFLLTPLLVVLFRVPLPIAVGSGLCQMIGTAIASLLRHRRIRQGETRFDLLMLPGCMLGVHAGARVLAALTSAGSVELAGRTVPVVNLVVELGYTALLLTAATTFWRQGHSPDALDYVRVGPLSRLRFGPRVDLPAVKLQQVSALLVAYVGLALGFVSGLLGVGGGIALMPVLVYGFGFPLRQAAGTGIIVLVATSTVGTLLYALRGQVNLTLSMTLLLTATISSQFGAMATRKLPAVLLRRLLATVILATVGAVVWDLVRHIHVVSR